MSQFKFGFAAIVLATTLSAAAYAAPSKGGGGGHPAGGGGGGRPGGGVHVGGGGVRGGGGAPHISAETGDIPFVCGADLARQWSFGRSYSFEQFRRPKDVPQLNRERSAQSEREHKRQNYRCSQHVELPIGRRRTRCAIGAHLVTSRTRANITATAATAAWHNGRDGERGWWRRRRVTAATDGFARCTGHSPTTICTTTLCRAAGYDNSFWGYGYGDIYAGLFAPYDYDELTGYLPQYASTNPGGPRAGVGRSIRNAKVRNRPARGDVAGPDSPDHRRPADGSNSRRRSSRRPMQQRAALDDLANTSNLRQRRASRPPVRPTWRLRTPPSRLAAMQQRIEAMMPAVAVMQSPLEKFFDLLSDEQKARLTALANDQRQKSRPRRTPAGSLAQSCGAAQPGVMEWPTADIDREVCQQTEAQRASLVALEAASTKAAEMLKASCPTDNPLTPPAHLAAIGQQARSAGACCKRSKRCKLSALNDFYGMLTDEQKAKFEAIGPLRTSQSGER